eukprot:GAHX01001745.1.p1 GENE.GAHX01001745.1~~GAHX01001745.1.p1  ORF type:complete len:395 (-),score=61.25 GAHX01001745.1:39-1223(-)
MEQSGDIISSQELNCYTTSRNKLNLLFTGYDDLIQKSSHFTTTEEGIHPMERPLNDYLNKSFIVVDKPSNPSSHEVGAWIKRILKIKKVGHAGTLDPKVTGCLVILLGKATKLSQLLSDQSKTYICVLRADFSGSSLSKEDKVSLFKGALEYFTGPLYQKPPVHSAVKRRLRVRTIYSNDFIEYCEEEDVLLFRTNCEAGTYIRTLCFHIGLYIGFNCYMKELRRIQSGWFTEGGLPDNKEIYNCEESEYFHRVFTMYDILDAKKASDDGIIFELNKLNNYFSANKIQPEVDFKENNYIKTVIRPIEALLMKFKRIFVKDNAIKSLSSGAKLTIPGIIRFDGKIEINDTVVVVSMKGEAIYVGVSLMNGKEIKDNDYGFVVKPNIVIMSEVNDK